MGETTLLPKYKALIQYVGTRYHGWQIQPKGETIQGVLEAVLNRLAGQRIHVVGAGRTDSGVHALGQTAHFFFPDKPSIPDLRKTLNAILPWDIRILRLTRVPARFHAQKDVKRKRYEYRILPGTQEVSPFLYRQCLAVPFKLDEAAMSRAAADLVGYHDFTSLAAAGTSVVDRRREVLRSEIRKRNGMLVYRIEARGFLQHMVRNIVGTLIEVGMGRREADSMQALLEARDRRRSGPTAPPDGLFLVRIWY